MISTFFVYLSVLRIIYFNIKKCFSDLCNIQPTQSDAKTFIISFTIG